jgi:hypothetical protein
MRMMRAAESVPSRPASRSAPIVRYEAREHYPIALLGGGSCPSLPVPRYALAYAQGDSSQCCQQADTKILNGDIRK